MFTVNLLKLPRLINIITLMCMYRSTLISFRMIPYLLEKHAGGRGHYISPSSQNDCIAKVMTQKVVDEVNSAKFYSVLVMKLPT